MKNTLALFLLFAGAAFAQTGGANYWGTIKPKLFRDLSSNYRGLFEHVPNQATRILYAKKETVVPGTTANCVVGLIEVPLRHVDTGMLIPLPPDNAPDPGIVIAPTLPTCPSRR